MIIPKEELKKGDALLLIDVQKDFCPGGSLAIEDGDAVVPILNDWIEAAEEAGIPVYASRDWHPKGHVSFREKGGDWPPHCIQDTDGAAFHPGLNLPAHAVIVTKGVRFDQDQNSALDQTGFAEYLNREGIKRLWIGGLALDVCVLATVLDARDAGIETLVILEGTKPVTPQGGKAAIEKMKQNRAAILS